MPGRQQKTKKIANPALSTALVAADVKRLRLSFLEQSWSFLMSAEAIHRVNARILCGILSPGGRLTGQKGRGSW